MTTRVAYQMNVLLLAVAQQFLTLDRRISKDLRSLPPAGSKPAIIHQKEIYSRFGRYRLPLLQVPEVGQPWILYPKNYFASDCFPD